jgi:hypothetical protein
MTSIEKIREYADRLNKKFDMEATGYAIVDLGYGQVQIADDQETDRYNAEAVADGLNVNDMSDWNSLWYQAESSK